MKYHMLNSTASMTQDGEFAGRIIQNNTTPYIDIFIREGIQNCMDAGDVNCPFEYVNVNFIINEFNKYELNSHLEEVTDRLNDAIPEDYCKYIAIKDTNTTGLVGPLKSTDIKNNETGNFRSLVYNIGKRQRSKGSGGSWGIGKTTFYRLSRVHLVIYYTRIVLEDGTPQHRLSAAMIENSQSSDGILRPDDNGNKSGIAWWGAGVDDNNEPYPIIDYKEIEKFLHIFGITPFNEDEVGTIVIIPYINESALLKNATTLADDNSQAIHTSWETNLEDALKVAIQRWYSPRLDNPFYYREKSSSEEKTYKYLRAYVNGEEIKAPNMFPIFQLYRDMYNVSLAKILKKDAPGRLFEGCDITTKVIEFNRINGTLGVMSYTKVKRQLLAKGLDEDPYTFVDVTNKGDNRMIVCMTRRPGMMVQYNPGDWMRGLPESVPDEVIIALFVLDPFATLKYTQEKISLEEYIRDGGENADHLGWHDHPIDSSLQKQNCVGQIFAKCHDLLLEDFGEKTVTDRTNSVKGLSALLGKVLQLKPNRKGGNGHVPRPNPPVVENGVTYDISDDIKYNPNTMTFTVNTVCENLNKASMSLCLNMDTSTIDCKKWEKDTMLKTPFFIKTCTVFIKKCNGNDLSEVIKIDENSCDSSSLLKFTRNYTSKYNKWYNLVIETKGQCIHDIEFQIQVELVLLRKDIRPNIKF